METTLYIEDDFREKAGKVTGIRDTAFLVKLGLDALIERESGKKLAKLGGPEKKLEALPRRR